MSLTSRLPTLRGPDPPSSTRPEATGFAVDASSLLGLSPDVIIGFGADHHIVFANATAERLLGRSGVELGGLTPDDLFVAGLIDRELVDAIRSVGEEPCSVGRHIGRHIGHALGTDSACRFESSIVRADDAGDLRLAVYARDITSRLELEASLRGLAEVDPLTGLLNHASFHDRVASALVASRDGDEPVGLIMVDLDYLKLLNDVHGHHVGDQAITAVARAIRSETRATDIVGRLGGDEFACALLGVRREDTIRLAERLVARICSEAVPGAGTLSASVGVAFVASTREPGDLFDRVDRALYDAKAAGRGVVCIASDTEIAYESRRTDRPGRTELAPVDLSRAAHRGEAARAALREWVHVFAASGGCIDLLDDARRSVRACTYYRFGHDDWQLATESYRLDDYPNTARAIERRETYVCRVDDPDADPAEVALLRERGFASLLLTPLVAGDDPIGIVELFDTRHRSFTTDDRRVALSLGSHLAALLATLAHAPD